MPDIDSKPQTPATPPRRGGRVIVVGGAILLGGVVLMLLPLALGRWGLNKYIVAAGFFLACWGIGCAVHGVWDLLQKR